ncbi:MAG TPA: hypothetical protein VNN76_06670 [Bacteroidota bacterium]|nr:hypothetical protein [Bacteroidota bacterium]
MKKDLVDLLLQLAYLEGSISTRGLYEKIVGKRVIQHVASVDVKRKTLARLQQALNQRVDNAEVPLTIGMFLQQIRTKHAVAASELVSRLGISANHYKMLENDRLSPVKLPSTVWKRFARLFNLPLQELSEMIRRTHILVFFRPSFHLTLARYDARKNRSMKKAALQRATEQLYTRANLSLPTKEEEKLQALIDELKT